MLSKLICFRCSQVHLFVRTHHLRMQRRPCPPNRPRYHPPLREDESKLPPYIVKTMAEVEAQAEQCKAMKEAEAEAEQHKAMKEVDDEELKEHEDRVLEENIALGITAPPSTETAQSPSSALTTMQDVLSTTNSPSSSQVKDSVWDPNHPSRDLPPPEVSVIASSSPPGKETAKTPVAPPKGPRTTSTSSASSSTSSPPSYSVAPPRSLFDRIERPRKRGNKGGPPWRNGRPETIMERTMMEAKRRIGSQNQRAYERIYNEMAIGDQELSKGVDTILDRRAEDLDLA